MELLLAPIATASFFVFGQKPGNKKDTVKSGKQLLKIKLRIKLPCLSRCAQNILLQRRIFISPV